MKLRAKEGSAAFHLTNPTTGETWVEPNEAYLQPWQIEKMVDRPELIRQFAHHLARMKSAELNAPVEVRVQSLVQLNDRPPAALVDPRVDLAKEPYRIGPSTWITAAPPSPR